MWPCRTCFLPLATALLVISSAALAQRDQRGLTTRISTGTALDGRGSLWAVVVGVSAYKNLRPEEQLRFAHRDAEEFAAFLRSPNGGGFPSTNIKLLLNQNATLAAVRTALGTWLPRSAEPDDVVYVFFAGHGVVEGEREGYLLAYDSDPQNLYATALSVAELDGIIRERVHARNIVMIADACHAGHLGWQSRGEREVKLINSYLDEVGKSGSGVLRILASRADQRSFEDEKWGGGHGAFTYFLLQGLRGKADKDKDHFVRAAELLEYLGETVPAETQALQQPRAAGAIDPRLPLSVVDTAATTGGSTAGARTGAAPAEQNLKLEVRGLPGSDIYLDKVFRGRIRPDGGLIIDNLSRGTHEFSVDTPGSGSMTQTISLTAPSSMLDLKRTTGASAAKGSPLVSQIRQSLQRGLVLERGGALTLYQQMVAQSPGDPQRPAIEVELSTALEEIGQRAISSYVNAPISGLSSDVFHRGALAYNGLKSMNPGASTQFDSKRLFCEGRALIVEGRNKEAIAVLKQAVDLDPKAAFSRNALGVAQEAEGKEDPASDNYRRAAELAPNWLLPRMHIGILYFNRAKFDKAEENFSRAVQIEPRDGFARLMLVRTYRAKGRLDDAERAGVELVRLIPNYAMAYAELGFVYEGTRQYDKAAAAFGDYLRLAPDSKDSAAIREREANARRLAGRRQPSLKKP